MMKHLKPWSVMTLIFILGAMQAKDKQEKVNEEQIRQLIKDLDHDDPERRDKATDELTKIGKPVLEALKKLLEKPSSIEVKERAERIVKEIERQIRRSKFKGGEIVCGLQATLLSDKDTFVKGEKISFELEIKNVDKKKREFVPIKSLDNEYPGSSSALTSSHGKILLKQISGEKTKLTKSMVGCGTGPDKNPVELKPEEIITRELLVTENLPEGEYEIQVIYYAKSKELLKDASNDLKSNAIRFNLVEKDKSEK